MGSIRDKKILCVEDDVFLADAIARKMQMQGANFILAKTGEEALLYIEKELPDLILLDIILPGMSGFDVLKQIKADERTKNVPVILLTNLGERADRERGMELGASLFLVKAMISLDEVVNEVQMVLDGPST